MPEAELAMFPLGVPLLPGATMALQVFEPRYRAMMADLLAADTEYLEFGVVMIERGREVGGGDVRIDVGVNTRILDLRTTPEGRFHLQVLGTHRIRVVDWLPDDPYPRARVASWPDEHSDRSVSANVPVGDLIERVTGIIADLAAHGEVPPGVIPPEPAALAARLADDPALAVYQLASFAPIGAADRARLLAAPSLTARVAAFAEALDDVDAALRFRRA